MIYAIGDIHGQAAMLRAMLKKLFALPLRSDDLIVFIGDYVDRGEDSCGVIEALIELKEKWQNTIFLRGNHEQLMLDARDGATPEAGERPGYVALSDAMLLWLSNGGDETLLSYSEEMEESQFLTWWDVIPPAHWEFIQQTRMEFIAGRFLFVHAGVLPPNSTWEGAGMSLDPRLWIREPFLSWNEDFNGRIVVFGHTPQSSGHPLLRKNKIGIDTGAVFGGPLTAIGLDPEWRGTRCPSPQIIYVENM